jgi:hypothetical protein
MKRQSASANLRIFLTSAMKGRGARENACCPTAIFVHFAPVCPHERLYTCGESLVRRVISIPKRSC